MSFLTDIIGGIFGNEANDKAADAQVYATDQAIDLQREQFEYAKELFAPQQYYGNQANALRAMNYGIHGFGSQNGQPQQAFRPQGPGAEQYAQVPSQMLAQFGFGGSPGQQGRSVSPFAPEPQYGMGNDRANGQVPGAYMIGPDGRPISVGPLPGQGRGQPQWSPQGQQQSPTLPGAQPQSPQDQFYDTFQQSGEYRSMIPVIESDRERIVGNRAAMGNSLSGAGLMQMGENMKRHEATAFNNYMQGLGNLATGGNEANQQLAGAGGAFANNAGNLYGAQGNARASAYANQYNPANALKTLESDAARAIGMFF